MNKDSPTHLALYSNGNTSVGMTYVSEANPNEKLEI